jgi:hypothetical protein
MHHPALAFAHNDEPNGLVCRQLMSLSVGGRADGNVKRGKDRRDKKMSAILP